MPQDDSLPVLFVPIELPTERELLATWLSSEPWIFHANPKPNFERMLEAVDNGSFQGTNDSSFWMMLNTEHVGLIHLFDLEDIGDGAPLFDLRIRHEFRGVGLGTRAVRWLTKYLFEQHASLERIEGTTRSDNLAMRRVFRRCGFAKEAHFRRAWTDVDGQCFDTVGYGILRGDWAICRSPQFNGMTKLILIYEHLSQSQFLERVSFSSSLSFNEQSF